MDRGYRTTTILPGQRALVALAGPYLALALLFASTFVAVAGEQLLAAETPTATATLSDASSPTATATGTSAPSATPTATSTAAPTGTATRTSTPSATSTTASTAAPTGTATGIPSASATLAATSTADPTGTATGIPTAAATSAATATSAETATHPGTSTATAVATTPTPTATAVATTPTPTATAATGSPLPVVPAPGTISINTTWTAGSVYLVSSTTVDAGVTLTIQPGAVVKFSASGPSRLDVYGTLSARGTAEQPIVFTSYKDDAFGGDTSGDGSASMPARGDWGAIYVRSGGSATFEYAAVRYGGYALPRTSDWVWYRYSGNLQAEGNATLVVRNSAIGPGQSAGTPPGGSSSASLSIRYGTEASSGPPK